MVPESLLKVHSSEVSEIYNIPSHLTDLHLISRFPGFRPVISKIGSLEDYALSVVLSGLSFPTIFVPEARNGDQNN